MLSSICTSVKQRFYSRISVTKQILEEDKLLSFPFDSMDTFIELLKESAKDKETLSIKITIIVWQGRQGSSNIYVRQRKMEKKFLY